MKKIVKYGLVSLAVIAGFELANLVGKTVNNSIRWQNQEMVWEAVDLIGEEKLREELEIPNDVPLRARLFTVGDFPGLGYTFTFPDKRKLRRITLREKSPKLYKFLEDSGFYP
ncbi:hypothetical protein HN832_04805 [archaeon]|jgi:hypothetical protein|nr:hypothetical protein [archaeon]MBT4374007.1 hypothetical protein [archaeon]MBT4532103.1 hypothetical protein [archaeon]MBT7001993.1 hypothetical protein [archaeon]MBT7282704.1 hypothetical protein [archaeon]